MGPEEYYGYQAQPQAPVETPDDRKKRLLIFIGGGLGLLTILAIILSIVLAPTSIRPDLLKIAAQQNEIARVAELGIDSEDARRATKVKAANIRAVSLSNLAAIDQWGDANLADKFTQSSLSSEENDKTDAALEQAGSINNYEEVFNEAMEALLSGANSQIIASFDVFAAYPDLQEVLNNVGQNNQDLLDSISSE